MPFCLHPVGAYLSLLLWQHLCSPPSRLAQDSHCSAEHQSRRYLGKYQSLSLSVTASISSPRELHYFHYFHKPLSGAMLCHLQSGLILWSVWGFFVYFKCLFPVPAMLIWFLFCYEWKLLIIHSFLNERCNPIPPERRSNRDKGKGLMFPFIS